MYICNVGNSNILEIFMLIKVYIIFSDTFDYGHIFENISIVDILDFRILEC